MEPSLAPSPHLMRGAPQDNSDQALRDQLLNHVNSGPQSGQQQSRTDHQSSPTSQSHTQNIDPAIAGPGMMSHSPGESGADDPSGEGKKGIGKRELSTSKRAAQNRAAQRAFRQRKEGHIKSLEEKVRDYNILTDSYKRMQAENYQLRDYIISLQSRLLESQGEFPQPPVDINLDAPRPVAQSAAPTANMAASAASQLQASAAQAVAEGNGRDLADRTDPALTGVRTSGP